MKLTELDPEWLTEPRRLKFNCPTCPRDADAGRYTNVIIIPVLPAEHGWGSNEELEFERVTITPSIWHHCDTDPHFFIRSGEIQLV